MVLVTDPQAPRPDTGRRRAAAHGAGLRAPPRRPGRPRTRALRPRHVSGRLGDWAESLEHLTLALELFTELGDLASIGQVRYGLAVLLDQQHRYAEALEHALEALRLRRAFAAPAVVAVLGERGRLDLRAPRQARRGAAALRARAGAAPRVGSRSGAADTLDSMGYAYDGLADYGQAIAHYEQALDNVRYMATRRARPRRLILGDIAAHRRGPRDARRSWEQVAGRARQDPRRDPATSAAGGPVDAVDGMASERPARHGPPRRAIRPHTTDTIRSGDPVNLRMVVKFRLREEVLTLDTLNRALAAGEHPPRRRAAD